MNNTEYDPKWAVCAECDGQGRVEDGQGQLWLCGPCAGYGSPAARLYGEKHPDQIKPATLHAIDFDANKARQHTTDFAVEWSDISAGPWADVLYSTAADKGFR